MRELLRQISEWVFEIVDEIGKFFYQVVGKRGSRLQRGKLLPLLLAQRLSDEHARPRFPLRHSFGPGNCVERLHSFVENLIQFLQLLLKHVMCRVRLVDHR